MRIDGLTGVLGVGDDNGLVGVRGRMGVQMRAAQEYARHRCLRRACGIIETEGMARIAKRRDSVLELVLDRPNHIVLGMKMRIDQPGEYAQAASIQSPG